MKRGYHSTQDKIMHSIPRSEFLGVAVGFAIGMIVHGILNLDGSALQVVGAVIGFGIGYWIDVTYFAEKDVPLEQLHTEEEGV